MYLSLYIRARGGQPFACECFRLPVHHPPRSENTPARIGPGTVLRTGHGSVGRAGCVALTELLMMNPGARKGKKTNPEKWNPAVSSDERG